MPASRTKAATKDDGKLMLKSPRVTHAAIG